MSSQVFDGPAPDTLEPTTLAHLPAPTTEPARLILLGLDSPDAEPLLKYTFTHLLKPNDTLVILHTIPRAFPPAAMDFYTGVDITGYIEQVKQNVMDGMKTLVQDVRQKYAKDLDGVKVEARLVWGDPREVLVGAADKLGASMVIVGNRGRGALKNLVMGSVSSYVLSHSKVPVVVYREPVSEGSKSSK
ncbi:uncharacterized protein SPPG_07806 [Spizellomyces punctatus DAOM BR117]|uniref:UspA domain-containing protein n=1 Tax=Spizellomyces punctatus (strain DAOM BR117) TaxID=645134 RepID=A0A0L0H7P8_SPIPD|nr:uncharacterized protein SPPG_07806 [Spizellomyces punctatus DAOM BR117]KNC96989.1 hypothetical protein SPPG_07806 [Spizellomyces punctatus DAOM BR117]|eukprot:XP_016605029.1 hypothetical protein SPPG_07806 [Spizellomyces punctatus DAOM BR117]